MCSSDLKQGISFYSLQALFWNQLLLPGERTVKESDLKKFDARLDVAGDAVPVSFRNGNMTYAAELLGITRFSLYRKIEKLGL